MMTLYPLRDDTCQLAVPMRECSGAISYDYSRYSRNITWYGNILWSSVDTFECSPLFDGTDDYGIVKNGSNLMEEISNSGAISIIFWIKHHEESTGGYIISYGEAGVDNTITVRSLNNGQISFAAEKDGSPLWSLSSYNTINDNNFHFVAAVADGSEALLYLDSNLEDSASISEFWEKDANKNLYIGVREVISSGLQDWYDGYLCELRIYNRKLAQSEIQALELYYRNFEVRPCILCPRPTL